MHRDVESKINYEKCKTICILILVIIAILVVFNGLENMLNLRTCNSNKEKSVDA